MASCEIKLFLQHIFWEYDAHVSRRRGLRLTPDCLALILSEALRPTKNPTKAANFEGIAGGSIIQAHEGLHQL